MFRHRSVATKAARDVEIVTGPLGAGVLTWGMPRQARSQFQAETMLEALTGSSVPQRPGQRSAEAAAGKGYCPSGSI